AADGQGGFRFRDGRGDRYVVVAEKEGFEPANTTVMMTAAEGANVDLVLTSVVLEPLRVVAKQLDEDRITMQPRGGASTYEITTKDIETQPGGENNPLHRVLLQAPGVSQDSSSAGGIHVREQMGNLQYRINGIVLPEGATLFSHGGGLSPRLASSVPLLTATLPAQY